LLRTTVFRQFIILWFASSQKRKTAEYEKRTQQVIAPKRETATFLKSLRVKFYIVAGGFALGELHR
jgi:hypothetical protein